jgi:hypothetical protein
MAAHDSFEISIGDSAEEVDAATATHIRQLKEFWQLPLHSETVSDTESFIAAVAREDYWGPKKVVVDPRPILDVPADHQLSEYLNIIGSAPIEDYERQKIIALPAGSTNYFRTWWPDNHDGLRHTILAVSEHCTGFLFCR